MKIISKIFKSKIQYILLFVFGAISTYGFAPHYYTLLPLMSFLVFLFFLQNSDSKWEAFLKGYAFGAGYFVFGLAWVANALQVDAYTFENFGWLIPFVYLGSGIVMGTFVAFPSYFSARHKNRFLKLWSFPIYFSIFEWMRGWILTGLPWNKLGAIWIETPAVLQSVSIFGTLGLTFMTLLLIAACYHFIFRQKYFFIPLIVFCFWGGIIFYGNQRLSIPTTFHDIKIKLVQSGISQSLKWSYADLEKNFQLHISLSKTGEKADLILWPESAVAFDLAHSSFHQEQVRRLLSPTQTLLTGFIYRGKKIHNSLGVFTKNTGLNGVYHKHHLVPFGEYIPFKDWLPLEAIAKGIGGISAGEGKVTLSVPNAPSVAPAICYEGIFSGEIVDQNNRPEWIYILTNDAWYGLSRGPYQHLAEAQLRAVEEGLPVVRVAYNGISAVIDPKGKILISAPLQTQSVIDTLLPKPF